jgi:hypothetical protein
MPTRGYVSAIGRDRRQGPSDLDSRDCFYSAPGVFFVHLRKGGEQAPNTIPLSSRTKGSCITVKHGPREKSAMHDRPAMVAVS